MSQVIFYFLKSGPQPFCGTTHGCQMKISVKSQTGLKRSQNGQTECLKVRKKPNFVVLLLLRRIETSKLQEYH